MNESNDVSYTSMPDMRHLEDMYDRQTENGVRVYWLERDD
jgi:hypothetical protein